MLLPLCAALVALACRGLQPDLLLGVCGALTFAQGKEVLVTGASGRTGKLVVQKVLENRKFRARAFVRSGRAREELLKMAPGLPPEAIFVGDILSPSTLGPAMAGCLALVIVTSAVPRIRLLSLAKTLLGSLVGRKSRPKFRWKGGLKPEQVDWEGQRNQVDAAIAAGVSHIVLVGSMGGTQEDNFLNSIGDGEGDRILQWKRKAEVYLMDACKKGATTYTIIHPGGLTDTAGGERRLCAGVDDELLERTVRSIPRADVADLSVQALDCPEAKNRSFDVCADPAGDSAPSGRARLAELLAPLEGGSCDYSINPPES